MFDNKFRLPLFGRELAIFIFLLTRSPPLLTFDLIMMIRIIFGDNDELIEYYYIDDSVTQLIDDKYLSNKENNNHACISHKIK